MLFTVRYIIRMLWTMSLFGTKGSGCRATLTLHSHKKPILRPCTIAMPKVYYLTKHRLLPLRFLDYNTGYLLLYMVD